MPIWRMDEEEPPRICPGCSSVLGDVYEGEEILDRGVCPFCHQDEWPEETFRRSNPTYLFLDRLLVALPVEGASCPSCGGNLRILKLVPEEKAGEEAALRWSPALWEPFCPSCQGTEALQFLLDRHVHLVESPRITPPNEGWGGRWFMERYRDRFASRSRTGT